MIDDVFLARLVDAVGASGVFGRESLLGRDPGIDLTNLDAGLQVTPQSLQQVSDVLALCNSSGVSVVPHGGLTGLAGAASSQAGQLIVSTSRLNACCDIDPFGRTATVSAGTTLQRLSDAAQSHGLCTGIDIGSRGSTTIGGMIATNAGGGEAFRYGIMRHRVLGLEAVTATGLIMSDLKCVSKANEGLDVKQLFVGSEGTLGLITRAVLKLEPISGECLTAVVACDSAKEALALFHTLHSSADCELERAEIMWRAYAQVTARDLGLTSLLSFSDRAVYVIFEASFAEAPEDGFETVLARAMEHVGLSDAIVAQSERERTDIWRIREDSWGVQRQHPDGLWFDVSVPLARIDDYLKTVQSRTAAVDSDLLVFVMGHLGDGNLHFTVTKGVPIDDKYSDISAAVYDWPAGNGRFVFGRTWNRNGKEICSRRALRPGKAGAYVSREAGV